MNKIAEIVVGYLSRGVKVEAVRPIGDAKHPYGIVVTPEKGPEYTHTIETGSREEFMQLWKDATRYLRMKWDDLQG